MARYRGRVVIHKVDDEGNKIKNLKAWIKKHPGEVYFDSIPEWEVWKYLKDEGIEAEDKPSLLLFDGLETEEFVLPRQTRKAKDEGRNSREIKVAKQQSIKYTPDYYLPKFDAYIEVKGYADEVFKMRWKLFKIKGYKGYIVYSLDEFIDLYEQLEASYNNETNDNTKD